jgi:TonB family protein
MRTFLSLTTALLVTGFAAHAQDMPEQLSMAPAGLGAPRQILQKTPVSYPKSVSPQDREAAVMLRYRIEPDGSVDDIEVIKSSTRAFNVEAEKAVRGWVYAPGSTATPGTALVEFHAAK